jgi:hypothetical protein
MIEQKILSSSKSWYEIQIGDADTPEAKRWCHERLGVDHWFEEHGVWTWLNTNFFRFQNEKDFVLFSLRWS